MIIEELIDMKFHIERADVYIKEAIVRGRFEMRLKMLQHGAFKNLFPYRPRVLMAQITTRIMNTHADRRHHILLMNDIGATLPFLDLPLPFLDLLHCLSLTFHCLSLTFHCLSLTFHCLFLDLPLPFH